MPRPFEGLTVIDATHVLAGPFSTYQLALLGAEVIRVENPHEPDQSRETGPDAAMNRAGMGMQYLAQGGNKRSVTLDLKQAPAREALKRLVASADVFVENYRPGALERLGLGYEALAAGNRRLVYCSVSAFGHEGPRREETAYDNVIQAASGMMAASGTPEVHPVKCGVPVVDYATGTTAAFAIASALFHRERTGEGQFIDVAMLDVALILESSFVVNVARTGNSPKPRGNGHPYFATNDCYPTRDGLLMIGGGNIAQQRRTWEAVGRPDMAKADNEARAADRARETGVLASILAGESSAHWEEVFRRHRVPASRVRSMAELLADPHVKARAVMQRLEAVPGVEGSVEVPTAAFRLSAGGPRLTSPPPLAGADTEAVLLSVGYSAGEVAALRASGAA